MLDYSCIADISPEFGEFCIKNGGVIAQRIGKIPSGLPPFWFGSGQSQRGGRVHGGTVADMGVCKACLPSREANFVFDRCGIQFGTEQIKICE